MADAEKYVFTYQQVVEALIKQQGLHQGIWGIYVEFGIAGANTGPNEGQMLPTAIVPILRLGLTRANKESVLAVDAAKVNPAPPKRLARR